MKTYKHIAAVVAAAILVSGGGIATSVVSAPPAQAAATQPEVDAAVTTILNATNAERAKVGLAPLTLAPTLNTVAQNWTVKMANESFLYHNPNVFKEIHPTYQRAGENIAQGYLLKDVMNGWMNSPGHKANILGDFTHIGIGYWTSPDGIRFYTQDFGKYPDVTPSIITAPVITPSPNEFMLVWYNFNLEYITDYTAELYSSTDQLIEKRTLLAKDVDKTAPSVIFKGLAPKTTYTVKITANTDNVMGARLSSPTRTFQVTTTTAPEAPNPPAGFKASTPVYNSGFLNMETNLSWATPTGIVGSIDSYTVTVQTTGQAEKVFQTSATNLKVTGLEGGTDYTVQVVANVIGPDGRTTLATPPARLLVQVPSFSTASISAPTSLVSTGVTSNGAVIAWKAPTETVGTIKNYTVEVSPGPGQFTNIYTATGTSYTLTGLTAKYPYTVTVKANAVSLDGLKRATSVGATTTFTTAAPVLSPVVAVAAPVVTIGGVGADRLTASWVKPAVVGTLTGYRVTIKSGTTVIQTYTLPDTTTSKQILALAENTNYTIVVDALATAPNGINKAVATTTKTVKTDFTAASTVKVAAPSAFATTVSRSAVTATWRMPAVTGRVASYTVTLKEGTRVVKSAVTGAGKYSFTGLKANTVYTVTVTANAVSANGKYAASASVSKLVRTLL